MKSFFKKIIVALLTLEAKAILKKYRPRIVAITGSVGKTSTKDAVYAALAAETHVRKSEKSFNSEIGVPLTILGGQNGWNNPLVWLRTLFKGFVIIVFSVKYPAWLVLEVGADRPGDIKSLMWLAPDIVVFTQLSGIPVHVEFFSSPQALIEEKLHLGRALRPDGMLVVNADDNAVETVKAVAKSTQRVVAYGLSASALVRGGHLRIHYRDVDGLAGKELSGISFEATLHDSKLAVHREGVLGVQHIYPALAALATALAAGLNLNRALEGINNGASPPGRMRIINGIKDSTIIDDSYNSSPIALTEALNALGELKVPGRKIAALGDMLELGKYSVEEHRKAGKLAASVADILITVGMRAKIVAESARAAGMKRDCVYEFDTATDAGRFLDPFVGLGDVILVKGSQSVRMERIVEEIMTHPEDKEKLLVRQEAEWGKR